MSSSKVVERIMEAPGKVSESLQGLRSPLDLWVAIKSSHRQWDCCQRSRPTTRKKAGCREKSKDKVTHTEQFYNSLSVQLVTKIFSNNGCSSLSSFQSHNFFFWPNSNLERQRKEEFWKSSKIFLAEKFRPVSSFCEWNDCY